MVLLQHPPKLVYDDGGKLVEVILTAQDYLTYLRELAYEADWEELPTHLQDAIDRVLIDEVRAEKETLFDLESILNDADSK